MPILNQRLRRSLDGFGRMERASLLEHHAIPTRRLSQYMATLCRAGLVVPNSATPFGAVRGRQRSSASRRRTGPEGKRDEVVQFAQVEWLVQITDGSRNQRVDLCPGV
jgi:hypothetical protein